MKKHEIKTEEIVRRYQAGESSTQIGAALGLTAPAVIRRLRSAGETIRRVGRSSKIDEDGVAKVCSMVKDGHKRIVIAMVLGVSQSTVNKAYRMGAQ